MINLNNKTRLDGKEEPTLTLVLKRTKNQEKILALDLAPKEKTKSEHKEWQMKMTTKVTIHL